MGDAFHPLVRPVRCEAQACRLVLSAPGGVGIDGHCRVRELIHFILLVLSQQRCQMLRQFGRIRHWLAGRMPSVEILRPSFGETQYFESGRNIFGSSERRWAFDFKGDAVIVTTLSAPNL